MITTTTVLRVLLLSLSAFGAAQLNADELRVALVCATRQPCEVNGRLALRSISSPAIEKTVDVTGSHALVALQPGSEWELALESATHWAPRQRVMVTDAGYTLRVWPAAMIRGHFTVEPQGEPMPQTFQLRIQSPPRPGPAAADDIEATSIDCPIAPDGTWRCMIPRVRLDLAVRAKSFVPHYRWDIEPPTASPLDLGKVTLRSGASAIAWLDRSTVAQLETAARARLIRMAMSDSSPAGERLVTPAAEAPFNKRGMVQLTGVSPGEYILEVEAKGYATTRVPELRVFAGSETRLATPIRLEPPLDIELRLIPPLDSQGRRWSIEVMRREPYTGRGTGVARGEADVNGAFQLLQQPSGKYDVLVKTAEGSRYADRQVVITGPGDARQVIEMESVETRGVVTFGGEPLSAELLFGGESGSERIRATADDAGAFKVVLPRKGEWTVNVRKLDQGVHAPVQVTVEGDDELDIKVPVTEVAGWVVRPEGGRVKDAVVMLRTLAGIVSTKANERGEFRFRGLASGAATLIARDQHSGESSRAREVVASTGAPLLDLELQIISDHAISGSVWSQGQPVVGARITSYGFGDGSAQAQRTLTGLDGTFSVPVKVTATEIVVIVGAAGRTLQAFSVPPAADKPRLELEPSGGTLQLMFSAGARNVRLRYNGISVPISDLIGWARAQGVPPQPEGESLMIPNVAPGSYQLCFQTAVGGDDTCRVQSLARGGVAELSAR